MPSPVTLCNPVLRTSLQTLFDRYRLRIRHVAARAAIPGSFWGDSEAGLIGDTLFLRGDTPVHSALHEACHYICMDDERKAALHTDAGGDDEIITPTDLDGWLDTLESGLGVAALDKPRVIVNGMCYSDSFTDTLSAPGRIIIASAAANEESFRGAREEDNTRVGEYFLEEFFLRAGRGIDVIASTDHDVSHDYADAMRLRGASSSESLDTLRTLIRSQPRPLQPDQRRLRLAVLTEGVFAMVGAYTVGMDQQVLDLLGEEGVPRVGPCTLSPGDEIDNAAACYLYGGFVEQARVLAKKALEEAAADARPVLVGAESEHVDSLVKAVQEELGNGG